ncbi:hypothetical protein CJD36_016750 [Flavipsychrobacter stenotrophus]|uniref:Uncharacterized protein n=1 Tax=Flavipsychrobacter stenotrophus TaxID=2077091 RepID=A0A2S7SS96_9BACT|nr:ATP-binding protein [Flavipsychrobacter stenotrophus]PQJ09588.1 hypothetical protein CJD36_016750 [Flavipsychrobacter stenotrophus]
MKIKSLELINVKSHENTLLELSENINLITGANNSGKSTVIKALYNLQNRSFDKYDIRTSATYAKTYISIVDVSEIEKTVLYSKSDKLNRTGTSFTIMWGIYSVNGVEENLFYNSQDKVKRVKGDRVEFQKESDFKENISDFPRFSDNENLNNFIYPFLSKRKTEYYDTNTGRDQTFKVSDTLRNLSAKIIKIISSRNSDRYNKLCEDILGFRVGVIPTESANGNEPGMYSVNSSMIPIRSMGDGVANIVGFIVILLTENNKLFLVEELENDIHPKALKKLLDLIIEKASSNQFVISTHSSIVLKYLGAAPKSKIFFFDWKAETKIDGINENVPTTTVKEVDNKPETRLDILSKLGYDFFDFELHQSYLILEESSAEYVIRDFLIPNFVPELYGKIKTIAAKGVQDLEVRVHDFNRLFVFIHTSPMYYKKAWVIADGDSAGKECISKLQSAFKTWPTEHFSTFVKDNFEEYYPERFQEKVQAVLKMPHGLKKQDAKGVLVKEVMLWALSNREDALAEFKQSAAEVIKVLKSINTKLNKSIK